jgi:plastocyanin
MALRRALALPVVLAALLATPWAGAANASVAIQNFSFQPSSVAIAVGESVTWTQKDSGTMHTVTGDSFDSGNLVTGQQYSHPFSQAGTFAYHCKIHPNMQGTVTVGNAQPPPTQPPAPPPTAAPGPAPAPAPAPARPASTAAPRATTTVPPTTVPPTTTTLTAPAAAVTILSTPTTAVAAGGEHNLALPAARASCHGSGPAAGLVVFAAILAVAVGAGGWVVQRRLR